MTWTIARARNGHPALVRPDGSWAESRFAPDIDARRRVEEATVTDGEIVLVLGMGAGELPRMALEACGPSGRVVVAEPESGVVAAVRDAAATGASGMEAPWLNDPRVQVIAGAHPPDPDVFVRSLAAAGPFDRMIIHPGLTLPAGFEALETRLADLDVRRRSGYRFQDELAANVIANRARFLGAPGVIELAGSLSGADVVVAGGGPSLTAAARAFGPEAAWIAVGTALGPLRGEGVRPLLAVITDPQPHVALSLSMLPPADLPPLVVFPTSARTAVATAGALIAAFAENDGGRRLAPLRAEIGELPAGGTVTTTAIGLALLMGAARIFLAGVDLTETAIRSHADGTPQSVSRLASLARFDSIESSAHGRQKKLESAGDCVTVTTASGGSGFSRHNLVLYGRALEDLTRRYPGVTFLQIAPDALQINGVIYDPTVRPKRGPRECAIPSGTRMRRNGDLL